MQKPDDQKGPEDERGDGEDSGDEIIGVALRRSLYVIVALGCLGAIIWWLGTRPEEAPPIVSLDSPAPVTVDPVERSSAAPALPFTDITAASGIDFMHRNGARGAKLLPETMGGGVAFFDYGDDGDPDLLWISSSAWPGDRTSGEGSSLAFYENRGDGSFENETVAVGLEKVVYGMGVAVGDIEGDGDMDLYITALGRNLLMRQDGGRFVDITDEAGVAGDDEAWSTGATFADIDGDGDLDLFVCNYVKWSPEIDEVLDFRLDGIGKAYGPPQNYRGAQPYLFRNEGDGTFTDITDSSGVAVLSATGEPMAKSLAVLPTDIDGDGLVDFLIANDTVRNFFFKNLGAGQFEEVGEVYGLAYDRNGRATGAMGVDAAHFRNDENLGFAVGNFANEMSSIYVSQDDPSFFVDEAISEGLGAASRLQLTFGLLFVDFDLDGRRDILQVNGHIEDSIAKVDSSQSFRQPAQIFWNSGFEGFQELYEIGDLARPMAGRGAATADIDGDGDLDLAVAQNGAEALLLRNDQATGHHWLRLKLSAPAPNPAAYGAQVEVLSDGHRQRFEVRPTRGYLSQVERIITVGVGLSKRVDEVRVRWPGGQETLAKDLEVDTIHVIEQP